MTLVEMLVATTATLILMAAIAQVFAVFGSTVSGSRSVLDLDGRLRNVAWRLRSDLTGATARTLPPLSPDSGEGYFELIEGPLTDYQDASNSGAALVTGTTPVGPTDVDDVLLFTTRNTETPFIGRMPPKTIGDTTIGYTTFVDNTIESTVAEVAWFARQTPGSINPVTYTLYRKQLLVMGYVGADPFTTDNKINFNAYGSTWAGYYNAPCDISVRREANPAGSSVVFDTLIPNSLADLTRRESRFLHNPNGLTATGFPFAFVAHQTASDLATAELMPPGLSGLIFDSTSQRQGEDVVLDNVIAFDVRVFDPQARAQTLASAMTRYPGDPGYGTGNGSFGAYVDLGSHGTGGLGTSAVTPLTAAMNARSRLTAAPTYDTWSLHYEFNGADEDGQFGADQGVNGIDDNADDLADNPAEFETAPPYAAPLRGIEIRIRCYEPTSKQVRQITVRHTFLRR